MKTTQMMESRLIKTNTNVYWLRVTISNDCKLIFIIKKFLVWKCSWFNRNFAHLFYKQNDATIKVASNHSHFLSAKRLRQVEVSLCNPSRKLNQATLLARPLISSLHRTATTIKFTSALTENPCFLTTPLLLLLL